jgi:hypothetical protein
MSEKGALAWGFDTWRCSSKCHAVIVNAARGNAHGLSHLPSDAGAFQHGLCECLVQ